MPGQLWRLAAEGIRQAAEQRGFRACGGERDAHPRCGLGDAGCQLQKPQVESGELGPGQWVKPWDGGADAEHQPICGGVQKQPHLIGQRRAATGSIGGKLGLVQLDQVLGLAAGAVEAFIQPPRSAAPDVGDDIADIETLPCGLDACGDAAWPWP